MLRATFLPLALLFLASVVPSFGQMRRAEVEVAEREVQVKLGAPLTVECSLRPEQRADWRLDGKPVPGDMRPAEAPAKDALTARLSAPAARADHAGVYTCARQSPRIKVHVTDTEVPTAEPAITEPGAPGGIVYYEIRILPPFVLNCTIAQHGPVTWYVNGTLLKDRADLKDHIVVKNLTENNVNLVDARLTVNGRPNELDFGNYTCSVAGTNITWDVRPKPIAKLAVDTNVVEGQKLKITCKVTGRPCTAVNWLYSNVSAEDLGMDVKSALPHVILNQHEDLENAELVVEAASRADAGWYTCVPVAGEFHNSTTQLRVKDMYAALWPFLGICAEVFILCAVILVYEKRRTKPELDDSDTDNHDQKKS